MHKIFSNISLQENNQVVDYVVSLVEKGFNTIKLYGDLGAGKTTFTRDLIAKLTGREERVISPTFNLVQLYDGKKRVWHYDLYRLEDERELEELALDEALEDVVIVEWPEIAEKYLQQNAVTVMIEFTADMQARNFEVKYET